LKRKQIHCGEAGNIDNGSDTAIAQYGCAHEAVNPVQIPFQALDNHLLLPKKFIDHQPNLAAASFNDDRKTAIAGLING
jgi:hypothetical protein